MMHTVSVISTAIIFILILFTPPVVSGQPTIESIKPNTVYFGRGGDININIKNWSSDAYIAVVPEEIHVNEGVNLGGSRKVFVKNNIAYVADWFSGLHLYDIADPHLPKLISSFHTPGSPKGILVSGNYAFVGDDDYGLQIIDVKDPQNPRLVSSRLMRGLA